MPDASPAALQGPLHLQLIGFPVEAGAQPTGPLGERIFLQPGALAAAGEGLPPLNLEAIPLPEELLRQGLLLQGYQLWDAPEGGSLAWEGRIVDGILLGDLPIGCLPPCAIQLERTPQPAFRVLLHERNPAPGWHERVFLYRTPAKPFEGSAVLYLNQAREVASVELFHQLLRTTHGGLIRRCWVSLTT